MTETVSGSAPRGGKGSRKGLTIGRIHTREGVHPYDEVTWERRDVVMTNWRDGTVNFEQRGVEFPDFWSVNAANIVTTKYFRGAVGTPQREWSLKQLVDRVVGKYVAAGRENGYFASPQDAEIFDHELTYALIHQIFAFNSPVWFNVGTSSPQQVSACFILAVDDTMDSILDWYKEEGPDLQGRLRRRGQPVPDPVLQGAALLRRHGQRAGLLHARCGRVRRHHQVRRGHPPGREDGRPRRRSPRRGGIHRDQGARGREGPGSPRRRVRHGPGRQGHRERPVPERQQLGPGLRRVHAGGRAGRQVRPGGAADRGDRRDGGCPGACSARWPRRPGPVPTPGSSTTAPSTTGTPAPESGRITASNPCSEYVHLDNSSCNLASINLLKFLREDDTFAVERFRQITELIITAMDISICFADFPTEKITETTRAYRQLGIGYANLGALLMATGHAYDSDGGRAIAAAITSLMTGTAYRRSAELAAVVGPYDGYERNATGAQAGHAQARRGQQQDPGAGRDGRGDPRRRQQGLGQVRRAGGEERLPERAGLAAGTDRLPHRGHPGHHGSRTGPARRAGRCLRRPLAGSRPHGLHG